MADLTGGFSSVGGAIVERILSGGFIFIGVLVLIVFIIGVVWGIFYYRKFDIKIRIKAKRGTGSDGESVYKIYYDKGAIMHKRRDKRSFLRLLHDKVDLPCPPYESLQILAKGGNELGIVRESDTEYYYEVPGTIGRGYVMKDGRSVAVKNSSTKIIESDVAYWNQLRKRDNRKLFDMESLLMKVLPFIPLIIVVVGMIFFTYIWLDKIPGVLTAVAEVADKLAEAAVALRDVSAAQISGG